jgi:transcriptional regulator with XRE-family HTH domain
MTANIQLTISPAVLNQIDFEKEIKLHERLRSLREDKEYTMEEVAERINVKRQTYNGYEAAPEKSYHRSPSFEVLVRLASLYHVSTDYLIGVTDNPAPRVAVLDVMDILKKDQSMDKHTRTYISNMLQQIINEYTVPAV